MRRRLELLLIQSREEISGSVYPMGINKRLENSHPKVPSFFNFIISIQLFLIWYGSQCDYSITCHCKFNFTLINPESFPSLIFLKTHCFQLRPNAPGCPLEPGGPWIPRAPVSPLFPGEPAEPEGPWGPLGPGVPCFPRAPVLTLFPGEPAEPEGPWGPLGPGGPASPLLPLGPRESLWDALRF